MKFMTPTVPRMGPERGRTIFLTAGKWLAPSISAASKRTLGNIRNEVAKDEDGEHLSARGSDDDESGEGIEQTHISKEDKQRNKVGDHRHHHENEDGIPEETERGTLSRAKK
jgi:hypothetical protein